MNRGEMTDEAAIALGRAIVNAMGASSSARNAVRGGRGGGGRGRGGGGGGGGGGGRGGGARGGTGVNREVARRRLYLLVNIACDNAKRHPGVDVGIFKSEIIRINRNEDEMEKIMNTIGGPVFPGTTEDKFFRVVNHDIPGFARAVGALPAAPAAPANN